MAGHQEGLSAERDGGTVVRGCPGIVFGLKGLRVVAVVGEQGAWEVPLGGKDGGGSQVRSDSWAGRCWNENTESCGGLRKGVTLSGLFSQGQVAAAVDGCSGGGCSHHKREDKVGRRPDVCSGTGCRPWICSERGSHRLAGHWPGTE